MPDIKFHCPECSQKIGVDETAAGLSIDCPTCRSSLVIPVSSAAPVAVTVRRKLAVLAGSADSAYAELERRQKAYLKGAEDNDCGCEVSSHRPRILPYSTPFGQRLSCRLPHSIGWE